MKAVFFGTPTFAANVLKFLVDSKVDIVGVIAKPDKPIGRDLRLKPVPVKEIALAYNIPIYQPEKVSSEEFYRHSNHLTLIFLSLSPMEKSLKKMF